MQKRLLVEASNLLPDFNDYLLLKYRKQKIKGMEYYLDMLFKESVKLFAGKVRYLNYVELGPDERLDYIKNNPILRKKIKIQESSFKTIKFLFEFNGEIHPLYAAIPFLDHNRVLLDGTEYYPLLFVVEKGALHRTHNSVILKVMRAPLHFKRTERFTFSTVDGRNYTEHVITVKIHQRKKGRGNKRTDRTPLILYHLVNLSFDRTMAYYGFQPNEINIVSDMDEATNYTYIKIKEGIFLKVQIHSLDDMYKRRVIASYLMCLSEYTKYSLRDLLSVHPVYYKTVLGKYTYPSTTNGQLLFDNAEKHLETTKTLLDPPTQYQLSTIGVNVSDIYELLHTVFYSLDRWLIEYEPTDLYLKKIGALDQMMAKLVTTINNKQFPIINSKNEGLTQETVKRFVTSASQYENWLSGNTMFRASPSMYNDNLIFSILTKRVRSLGNAETQSSGKNKKKQNIPVSLLKAHASNLVVESVCSLPPSNPVATGEINPFLNITENGDIIKPDWATEYDDIFD